MHSEKWDNIPPFWDNIEAILRQHQAMSNPNIADTLPDFFRLTVNQTEKPDSNESL